VPSPDVGARAAQLNRLDGTRFLTPMGEEVGNDPW
jgi:hypothetical protein